jgi:hypothetical protein
VNFVSILKVEHRTLITALFVRDFLNPMYAKTRPVALLRKTPILRRGRDSCNSRRDVSMEAYSALITPDVLSVSIQVDQSRKESPLATDFKAKLQEQLVKPLDLALEQLEPLELLEKQLELLERRPELLAFLYATILNVALGYNNPILRPAKVSFSSKKDV